MLVIAFVVVAVGSFVGGVLVGRRNKKTVEAVVEKVKKI